MRKRSVLIPVFLAGALVTGVAVPAESASRRTAADSGRDGVSSTSQVKVDRKKHSGARADGDGDGLINLREFRLGGNPSDEDTDNDGQDDGDEVTSRTNVKVADTDRDGILDGDEDHDRDGIANEDEDDAREACAKDDDDLDGDNVSDEDENELGLTVGDSDSDDDGIDDGSEDSDDDATGNEDEDDDDRDRCNGDLDGDGRSDEDEGDVFGAVTSYDDATGTLVVTDVSGGARTFVVTVDTEIEVEVVVTGTDGETDADDRDGTVADLLPGTEVAEVDVEDGEVEEITLREVAAAPSA